MRKTTQLLILFTGMLTSGWLPVSSTQLAYDETSSNNNAGSVFQDSSMLPPEVLPLQAGAANELSVQEAKQRQMSMNTQNNSTTSPANQTTSTGNGSTPGLTAQEYRKQAFEQLYGNSTLPANAQTQILGWQNQMQSNTTPAINNFSGGQNMGAPNNQIQQDYVPQSQTLSGGAKEQPTQTSIHRGGFSNGLSYASAFTVGALTSTLLTHPTNLLIYTGIYGLTTTGLGVSNGSRF